MAQSEDADVDDAAACQMAMEAALEKGMEYCGTQEDRLAVLGKIVGIDNADEIDTDARLDAGPSADASSRETREWVLARAEEVLTTTGKDPLDAINQAWADLGDEMPDPDESTAGAADEEEEAVDEEGDEPEPEVEAGETPEIDDDEE